MRPFSIRMLMVIVIIFAVGLAALRNASDLWVGTLLLADLFVLGTALMGAVILRGREQHWCIGFVSFAGFYLALSMGPWLSDAFQPRLGTTHALRYAYERTYPSVAPPLEKEALASLLVQREELLSHLENAKRVARHVNDPSVLAATRELKKIDAKLAANQAAPSLNQFQNVGHSIFSLLIGLVGGTVATWFYVRRERAEVGVRETAL
jgi:hypothetical protein